MFEKFARFVPDFGVGEWSMGPIVDSDREKRLRRG
jgi:hypothetical protein